MLVAKVNHKPSIIAYFNYYPFRAGSRDSWGQQMEPDEEERVEIDKIECSWGGRINCDELSDETLSDLEKAILKKVKQHDIYSAD